MECESYNETEIRKYLDTNIIGREIKFYDCIDSTNSEAYRLAKNGCEEGLVVISDIQTKGKGRLGRLWESEGGKGIWLSCVLKPNLKPKDVGLITLASSISVIDTIFQSTGIRAYVKWPNDIIINGRKVCGILTEMCCDTDEVKFIILGIGLNVNHGKDDFAGDLKDKATSLAQGENRFFDRSRIAGMLINEVERIYNILCEGNTEYILSRWKSNCFMFGKEIKYYSFASNGYGYAKDINDDGNLIVKTKDGTEVILKSGEVSVRGVMGYDK